MTRYLGPGDGGGDSKRPLAPWDGPDAVGPGGKRRRDLVPAPAQPEPLTLASEEAPPRSREASDSFWGVAAVEAPPRHGNSGSWPIADQSLSGEGDEFDPATGWTFGGLDSEPMLTPVAPYEVAPAPPIATADELFGPAATGGFTPIDGEIAEEPPPTAHRGTPPQPATPPERAPRPTKPPAVRSRGLEIPDDAAALRSPAPNASEDRVDVSMEVEIDDDDDIVTRDHPKVPDPVVPDLGDDVDALLAKGREHLSNGEDGPAVRLLRRAQRIEPGNTSVQTWRELGERRLLQAHLPGAKPSQIPRLAGHRLDFWESADELERQLLVAIDGKRSLARLMTAAPDDKLVYLLSTLASFVKKGWLSAP